MEQLTLTDRALVQRRAGTRTQGIRQIVWIMPLLDAIFLSLSLFFAYLLRFKSPWWPYHATYSPQFYTLLVIRTVPIWLIIFTIYRLYDPAYLFGGTAEYARLVNACTMGLIVLIMYSFFQRGAEDVISRGWLVTAWALSILVVGGYRFAFRRVIYALRRRGHLLTRVIVVGANEESRAIIEQFRSAPSAGVHILGLVDDHLPTGRRIDGLPVLGGCADLRQLVHELDVHELIISPTALGRQTFLDLYRTFGTNGEVDLKLSPGLFELFTTGVQVQERGFVPLLSLNKLRITGIDAFMKTVLDYTVAGFGVIMLAPLFLLLAVLVKLDSPGPAIYRRRVLGVGGKEFDAFKFRTMRSDGDEFLKKNYPELWQKLQDEGKLKDDPRVTRLGRFLRRSSLDELPQLFNVLRGEMSLVGPRMISPTELRKFGSHRYNLLTVKPGITGLWQISGRSDLGYEDRVRLDMHYIRNYTIWLDLRILFNTFRVVLQGKGAY